MALLRLGATVLAHRAVVQCVLWCSQAAFAVLSLITLAIPIAAIGQTSVPATLGWFDGTTSPPRGPFSDWLPALTSACTNACFASNCAPPPPGNLSSATLLSAGAGPTAQGNCLKPWDSPTTTPYNEPIGVSGYWLCPPGTRLVGSPPNYGFPYSCLRNPNVLDPDKASAGDFGSCTKKSVGKRSGNPIDPSTGNKYQGESDYVSGTVYPLHFDRYYNSSAGMISRGVSGLGWVSNSSIANGTPYIPWFIFGLSPTVSGSWTTSYSPSLGASSLVRSSPPDTITINRPGGIVLHFNLINGVWCQSAG